MHTLSEGHPDQTLRTDVTDLGKTLPYQRRDQDRDYYFFSADPSFTSQRGEALQYAKDAYGAAR